MKDVKDLMSLMCNSQLAAVFDRSIIFNNYHVKYFVINILEPLFAFLIKQYNFK